VTLVRAVALLAADVIRRLLREGLVVRSLLWPGLLVAGTLAAVLGLLAFVRVDPVIGVGPGATDEVVAALQAEGLEVRRVDDPLAAVTRSELPLATDGRTLWDRGSQHAVRAEIALRRVGGATWTMTAPPKGAPNPQRRADVPVLPEDAVVRVLSLLFALYGLVFGLAGVARDRDGGILDAELCLPIPRWATGFARWLGTSVVLAGFLALSVAVVSSVLPTGDPLPGLLHGVAATLTAVGVGMAVVGRAGLRHGFSGPFGVGMTVTTVAASLGWRFDLPWFPVASLFSSRPGWVALGLSVASGAVASAIYARRSGGPP
jgi:hypothetical protein